MLQKVHDVEAHGLHSTIVFLALEITGKGVNTTGESTFHQRDYFQHHIISTTKKDGGFRLSPCETDSANSSTFIKEIPGIPGT